MLFFLLATAWAAEVTITGHPATATASSELASKTPGAYAVANLFDNDPKTAWVEGVDGDGAGQRVDLVFAEPVTFDGLLLTPGYAKSDATFTENAAAGKVLVLFDERPGATLQISYETTMHYEAGDGEPAAGPMRSMGCYHLGTPRNQSPRLVVFSQPRTAKQISLVFQEAVPGSKYHDLAISEWTPLIKGTTPPPMPAATAKALPLLLEARSGQHQQERYAATFEAIGVMDDRIRWDDDVGAFAPMDSLEMVANISAGDAQGLAVHYWKAEAEHLFDAPLSVWEVEGEIQILGTVAASKGDGEWLELYPIVVLDQSGTVRRLEELPAADGAPGCRARIPR